MWSGRLGKIYVSKLNIELTLGAWSIYQVPYQAGQRFGEFKEAESSPMRDAGIIEATLPERDDQVVFFLKKDVTLRSCVDYRRLNAVKNSYPVPCMDGCIDSPGDAAIYTTLDCNSG